MTYITLALTAFALWALTNVIDKVVLGQRKVDPLGYLLVSAAWSPLVLLTLPFARLEPPGMFRIIASLAAGACFFSSLFPYFRAAEREEISRVAPLWQLAPIFVWLFAWLTLGEKLSLQASLAFTLLVGGGVLLAARSVRDLFNPSPALLLMILATALLAAHNTLAKAIVQDYDPITTYLLIRCGMVLAAAFTLLGAGNRAHLRATVVGSSPGTHALIMLTVVLSVSGFFFFISALERGPVTIVSALGGFSGLFIIGFVLLFNIVSPGMLIEESSPRILFQKFSAILLLALGLLVLNV